MLASNGKCIFNKRGSVIAAYIRSCYKSSMYCDLVLITSGNEKISCHKLVLCSLSQRLLSTCSGTQDSEDTTYVLLPQFTHQEVKSVVDRVYGCLDHGKVEMPSNEVTAALGIESTPLRRTNGPHDHEANRKRHGSDALHDSKRRKSDDDIDNEGSAEWEIECDPNIVKSEFVLSDLEMEEMNYVGNNVEEMAFVKSAKTIKQKRKVVKIKPKPEDYPPHADMVTSAIKDEKESFSDSSVEDKELIEVSAKVQESRPKRPYNKTGKFKGALKKNKGNDQPTGPSAEELLAQESDAEVLALQEELVALEPLWKPHDNISSEVHKWISECDTKRILVKRAGARFNLAPLRSNKQWAEMEMSEKPSFAAILGVKKLQENSLDPRLIKFNGELVVGRPLAWSLPRSGDDVKAQYNAVMDAYKQLLGFSDEELHCTTIFLRAQFGGAKGIKHHKYGTPKEHVRKKISKQLRVMSKEVVCDELMRLEVKRVPERNQCRTNFDLDYDRCRLQLDDSLQTEDFEGLMVVAWYGDGQSLGKVLNFDQDPGIFLNVLKDVWTDVKTAGSYKLPFTDHMYQCFMSVYERTFASEILPQLMDGSAPSKICSMCGKLFYMISEYDRTMYIAHTKTHDHETPLVCDCEDAKAITSASGRERHKKLYHSDGKFVECSIPKCTDIIAVGALDEHIKDFHMVNLFCEQCGISFNDKKLYKKHYNMNHVEVECKVCKLKFPSRVPLTAHMRTHKGEPHPCLECGKEYPDRFILNAHIRQAHTPNDQKPFQCPYPGCGNGYIDRTTLLIHLNNIHFKKYLYCCQYGCSDASYKDQSNLRQHYKKKHDLKYKTKTLRLEDCFKLMTEEEQVYHESILHDSSFYKKLQQNKKK